MSGKDSIGDCLFHTRMAFFNAVAVMDKIVGWEVGKGGGKSNWCTNWASVKIFSKAANFGTAKRLRKLQVQITFDFRDTAAHRFGVFVKNSHVLRAIVLA